MSGAPDAIALIDRSGTLTYAALDERVARARGALAARGIGAGDRVLVVTANDRESAIAYHAVVGLGATAVLTQFNAGAAERCAALDSTKPAMAVFSPAAIEAGIEAPDNLDTVAASDLAGSAVTTVEAPDPDAPRLVVFTSGTTSTPKGVIHTARSLAAAAVCFQAMLQLTAQDRLFLVSPLASITGVLQALELAPALGGAVVLEGDFDDDRSLDLLRSGGATAYGGPDLVLDRLLESSARRNLDLPLRVAALGGTMLRAALIDRAERDFGIRVVRVYGSSEAPCSTGTRPDEPDDIRLGDEGVPGPGVELSLADNGELLVRGPHLFRGYTDATDEDGLVDGWFATGDQAELAGGRLRIVGRLKDVVSRNGKKISLAEVDRAFTTASGITDCAAFGVADDRTGERVAMAVHLPPGTQLDIPAAFAAMEAGGLARHKLPETIIRHDRALPATATGKIRRSALDEHGPVLWRADRLDPNHPGAAPTAARPRSPTRKVLHELGFVCEAVGDEFHGTFAVRPTMWAPGTEAVRTAVLMTLADAVLGLPVIAAIAPQAPVTLELGVDLVDELDGIDELRCAARLVKAGSSVSVTTMDITDRQGHLVGRGSGIFAIPPVPAAAEIPGIEAVLRQFAPSDRTLTEPLTTRTRCERTGPGQVSMPIWSDVTSYARTLNGGLLALAVEEAALSADPQARTILSMHMRYVRPLRQSPVTARADVHATLGQVHVYDSGGTLAVEATTRAARWPDDGHPITR